MPTTKHWITEADAEISVKVNNFYVLKAERYGFGPWSIYLLHVAANIHTLTKVTEGISGQQGTGHGPSFRSQGAVFTNNCTALESSKVGYAYVLWKNC